MTSRLTPAVSKLLSELPLIKIQPGFRSRAGALRASALKKRRKARLGDSLIAQSCLEAGVPLLTRDRDFRAFAEAASLDVLFNVMA